MAKEKAASTWSENEVGAKLDRCFADSLLKLAGGFAIGVVTSVALFKGRMFPVWLGSGIGIGMGWSNCRHDLEAPFLLHGRKVPAGVGADGKPTYQIIVHEVAASEKNCPQQVKK